jgi:hypothetical protein
LSIFAEINKVAVFAVDDKGKIQIPQIMKNGTATGQASDHFYVVLADMFEIDFSKSVLVFADYNGVVISPKHENVVLEVFE